MKSQHRIELGLFWNNTQTRSSIHLFIVFSTTLLTRSGLPQWHFPIDTSPLTLPLLPQLHFPLSMMPSSKASTPIWDMISAMIPRIQLFPLKRVHLNAPLCKYDRKYLHVNTIRTDPSLLPCSVQQIISQSSNQPSLRNHPINAKRFVFTYEKKYLWVRLEWSRIAGATIPWPPLLLCSSLIHLSVLSAPHHHVRSCSQI